MTDLSRLRFAWHEAQRLNLAALATLLEDFNETNEARYQRTNAAEKDAYHAHLKAAAARPKTTAPSHA